jgi:hypothetical protein
MVRLATETEAHMPDYGSGSFLLKNSDLGHADLLFLVTETEAQTVDYGTGSFTLAGVSSVHTTPDDTDLLFIGADGSTEGTRLFVGNLTVHSSEVPNTAFGIDWLLW